MFPKGRAWDRYCSPYMQVNDLILLNVTYKMFTRMQMIRSYIRRLNQTLQLTLMMLLTQWSVVFMTYENGCSMINSN